MNQNKKSVNSIGNRLALRLIYNICLISIVISVCFNVARAQDFSKTKPYGLMVGLHYNWVVDEYSVFGNMGTWNTVGFPLALNVDYYFEKGMSIEGLVSYNYYHNRGFDSLRPRQEGHFLSVDLNGKYSIGFLLEQQRLDPFVFAGLFYTGRETKYPQNSLGLNAGAGLNFMLYGRLGIQMRGTFKFAATPELFEFDGNYIQLHTGIIYKIEAPEEPNLFLKPKHGWIKKKVRYKPGKKRL